MLIEDRNPIYKDTYQSHDCFERLWERKLIGLDLLINNHKISVQKRKKYVITYYFEDWLDEYYGFKRKLRSNIYLSDDKVILVLNYMNEDIIELHESEIVNLEWKPWKTKRCDLT